MYVFFWDSHNVSVDEIAVTVFFYSFFLCRPLFDVILNKLTAMSYLVLAPRQHVHVILAQILRTLGKMPWFTMAAADV